MSRDGVVRFLVVSTLILLPAIARAQAVTTGSIAGTVRDESGAVLPGVTVEAASPALIEKVRTTITDGEGRYNVIDLRPGTYTVTFTLTGFSTVRREGIALSAGFAATVNADLRIGALEETITVTGQTPLVDTQNVRQQAVVSDELLAALPSGGKGFSGIARLVPGMTGGTDVGGAAGIYTSNSVYNATVHGKSGGKLSYDGMVTNNLAINGAMSYVPNPSTVEETVVELGGISAESDSSGVLMNLVPKEGGNTFRFSADTTYTNRDLQGDNFSDELRARGLAATNKVLHVYDVNVTQGGPVKRDRLWFFAASRFSGSKNEVAGIYFNSTRGSPFYTPDLNNPAFRKEWLKSIAGRLTWQIAEKHKLNVFGDVQSYQVRGFGGNEAPEAITGWQFWPAGLYQATWSSPQTNQLLFDGGVSLTINGFPYTREDITDVFGFEVPPTDISILEASTGLRYNAKDRYYYKNQQDRYAGRFSASYVTGAHAFKAGMQMQMLVYNQDYVVNESLQYTFNRAVPTTITMWAQPLLYQVRTKADFGLYAQDKWAIRRLTLNYGLRFEYYNGYVPENTLAAGRFVGARTLPATHRLPEWTDLNPRFGGSYDLLGDGRTALKGSIGRYVGKMGTTVGVLGNPLSTSVNSVNRTWNDQAFGAGDPRSGNYVPDCNLNNFSANGECEAISNINFGQNNPNAQQYDDDLLRGFGVRDYFWDVTAEVQHQLTTRISVTAGYYRNWTNHFDPTGGALVGGTLGSGVVDNQAVTPADYDPYCITAPVNSGLPGGGGYQLCGLYDLTPSLFGQGQEVVRRPSHYGDGQSRTSDFFTVSMNARLDNGVDYGASVDVGQSVDDKCFVVDSPQALLNCRVVTPFSAQTQVKAYVNYRFPYDILVSGVFQNLAGIQHLANYAATNAEIAPVLGRNLAACGTRVVCTATATVPLIAPQTDFEPRRNLFDLRLSKQFSLGAGRSFRANFDIYNLLNDDSVTSLNTTYGAAWLRPLQVLNARLIQFGGQVQF
jgi:hypothetical protein